MADTLNIYGVTYQGVEGIKGTDSNNIVLTYVRPQGTKTITQNGTGIDVAAYADVDVNVSGGGSTLGTKTITANGEYDATDDNLDGYSAVTVSVPASAVDTGTKNISISANGTTTENVVGYASASITANVPNSYTQSDEGKVVSNGALVAQTAHADVTPTTSDQTIDTTTNNSIKVKGDADLVAGNIKKDVEIFGVTGSYEGGGGTAGATGTFTPASDTTSYIVDTGIDFTQFAFAATIDIGGSGKRSVRTGFCDFAVTNYVLCYFTTNNSGTGIASDSYGSSSGYFTKNGTSITISKSGTYMLGGVTYRWIAT